MNIASRISLENSWFSRLELGRDRLLLQTASITCSKSTAGCPGILLPQLDFPICYLCHEAWCVILCEYVSLKWHYTDIKISLLVMVTMIILVLSLKSKRRLSNNPSVLLGSSWPSWVCYFSTAGTTELESAEYWCGWMNVFICSHASAGEKLMYQDSLKTAGTAKLWCNRYCRGQGTCASDQISVK